MVQVLGKRVVKPAVHAWNAREQQIDRGCPEVLQCLFRALHADATVLQSSPVMEAPTVAHLGSTWGMQLSAVIQKCMSFTCKQKLYTCTVLDMNMLHEWEVHTAHHLDR